MNLCQFEEQLSGYETTADICRLAVLAAQLPRDARTLRAFSPALAWSDETYLLARCDYMLRVIAWMFSEDGANGTNQPKPISTPAEIAENTAQIECTDFAFVDSILFNTKREEVADGGD